ncbi:hypothetical protein Taro_036646, partial [Colocasia esculenta]|nr:hypothetical protein [Colocasia esculenta]
HLRRQCFEGLRLEFGHVSFVDLGLLQDFDERRSQLFAPGNGVPYEKPTGDILLLLFFLVRGVEDERVRPYLRFRGRLRLFSSEDDSLAQVGRVGLLAEGRGGFLSSSAALPFASVAAPICCHRGSVSRRL